MTKEEEEKDITTPEEREKWLRDRGVLIESPEDRRQKNANKNKNKTAEDGGIEFSCILIPANSSYPLKEVVFIGSQGGRGDALTEQLKASFATNSDKVDTKLLLQQQQESPVQHLIGGDANNAAAPAPAVSEEVLGSVAKEGHVEVFNLVHATSSNNYVGVNIYLDEVGMIKRLPVNKRASDYALLAGYNPPPTFYGDIYLGRVRKKGPIVIENISMALDHYINNNNNNSSQSPPPPSDHWLAKAIMENLEYQTQMNQLTGRTGANIQEQPKLAGSDGVEKQEIGFSFTQTEEECELLVPIPTTTTINKKELKVKFKSRNVQVSYQKIQLLSLELFEKVDIDGCTWTIDQKNLVITLEKIDQALWPRIVN